tara:strand:- start:1238 stop:2587 length:1350 start_codon:yes stop_codon:yes gene_type:complete
MKQVYIIGFFLFQFNSNAQESIRPQINPDLFGFCTSNTFTYCDINDTNFTTKVNEINPNVLRFPGGLMGNFYHYHAKGYGFDVNEVANCHGQKFPKRVKGLIKDQKTRGHTHNYIDDFIVLAKQNNSKVIIVANIITSKEDEIIYVIKQFRSEGIQILGVELGSELSNRAYKSYINSVEDYILLAKKYSSIIKEKYPEIKVGVVAAPIKQKTPRRLISWNERLSRESFYDAVICHSYLKVIDGDDDYGLMVREDKIDDSKEVQFDLYKDRVITYFNSGFVKEIERYNKIFDKEIWLTEWNLQMSKTTGNTMLQSLFVAQYFLELLSNSKLQGISISTYHNLGGRDVSGSIFMGGRGKDDFDIHSTFYPLTFISQIFQQNIVRIDKKIEEGSVFSYYCFDLEDNLSLKIVINWRENKFSSFKIINGELIDKTHYISQDLFSIPNNKGHYR